MDIDALQTFVHIARAGSLSAAARQLGLGVATVSARLQRLEAGLQTRLVERNTRSLHLSDEGERFLATAERLLQTWGEGVAQLRDSKGATAGRLRIAAPSDTSLQWLAPWLAEYAATQPALELTVLVGDQMHALRREAVDLAIRYGALDDSSLVSRLLAHSERVLVASPSYLARAGTPAQPQDLLQHRCLAWLRRGQQQTHWRFEAADGRSEAVAVRPALSGDGLLVRAWALAGAGIAYKARLDVAEDLRAGRLQALLPGWRGEPTPVQAVLAASAPGAPRPERLSRLLAFLQHKFAGLG